jgi:hypothetical protein
MPLRGKAKRLLVLVVLVGGLLPTLPAAASSTDTGGTAAGSVADGWSWDG